VICQPTFDDELLYWESMNDLLRFARVIADTRIALTSQMLLELVNAAKPQILAIRDFENPRVQFEQIFLDIIASRLTEALNYALPLLDRHSVDPISRLNRNQLFRYRKLPAIVQGAKAVEDAFTARANEIHPHILMLSPDTTFDFQNRVRTATWNRASKACLDRCVSLLPEIRDELWNELSGEIDLRLQQIAVVEVDQFNFSKFSTFVCGRAAARFTEEARKLNEELPAHLSDPVKELQAKVSSKIKRLEASKKAEFRQHSEAEARKRDADMEARFAQEIGTMSAESIRAQKAFETKLEQERQATAAAHARERLANQQREAAAAEEQRKLAAQLQIESENRARTQQEFEAQRMQWQAATAQMRRDFESQMTRMRNDFDVALQNRSKGGSGWCLLL
jgi:hypothetical protein